MSNSPPARTRSHAFASPGRFRAAAVVLLLLFFLQVATATTRTSLTSDEGPQLTSGYSYLVTGDPRLIEFDAHPPLAKIINAAPLLLVPDLGSPADTPAWHSDDPMSLVWAAEQFFYPYRPLDRLVVAGRLPVALWGVLLGALMYRWAADLFGPLAGLGALFLMAFDPNLLAHAGLATNDLPVTAASLGALFTFWRFLRRPTLGNGLLAGLLLGVAQSTKLNALLLLPVEALLALAYAASAQGVSVGPRVRRFASRLKQSALVWCVGAVTLWATYGFELRQLPGWPIPVPAGTHLLLWGRVTKATGGGHPGFLMGQLSREGWWHYFPVAFGIKTPLPTLLLLLLSGAVFLIGWRRKWTDELAIGAFAVLYAGFTVFSRLNIGYRHLLPVLPLLYIFAARLFAVRWWPRLRGWRRAAPLAGGTVLAAWLVVGTAGIWPFHLAFFNEIIGGPDQGYHYLVDSNADWGQTLKALRQYMDRQGIERVRFSTFIEYGDAVRGYGIAFDPLPPLHDAPGLLPARFNPAPGDYAISSTTLQGISTADPEMFDWFRQHTPDALIGHVLPVYHIPDVAEPGSWVAQCLDPVPILSTQMVAEGFGREDLRNATFDCTQSWLIPDGGRSQGWYVLTLGRARGDDPFIQSFLEPAQLGFEQTRRSEAPPFAIYEAHGQPVMPAQGASGDVRVGGLSFLGHTVRDAAGDQSPEIWTFWRVEEVPERPLSLMLHLVPPGGAPAGVADGLGVPVENWQVGDVIVQRHVVALPPDAPRGEYTPYTGAYWLGSLERWPVSVGGQPAGDQLVLPPVMLDP